ncbi:hypothetical protein K435DRAFT_802015 [Dendrothele bispora CBS 962.96]|uniref:Uncharacterized protein n=1 Tax=Dendrothele bispora (strain CBS 962.96) TaxID=1314807 RepID=A0A4S8LMG8_DENBC|nr:hypothetical protein K435DRAFT_802015 [Dendrothele bispora CBS 962.96]
MPTPVHQSNTSGSCLYRRCKFAGESSGKSILDGELQRPGYDQGPIDPLETQEYSYHDMLTQIETKHTRVELNNDAPDGTRAFRLSANHKGTATIHSVKTNTSAHIDYITYKRNSLAHCIEKTDFSDPDPTSISPPDPTPSGNHGAPASDSWSNKRPPFIDYHFDYFSMVLQAEAEEAATTFRRYITE